MATNPKMSVVDIDTLRPNPWNTNHVSAENEKKLDESFKKFGCYKPIIVRQLEDGSLEILGGEHRWGAARRAGHKTVPIANLGAISDQTAKEIGLVDNGRYGEDDSLELAALLNGMDNLEEIMGFLPYAEDDLSAIFASSSIDFDSLSIPDDDDRLPELPTKAAVQTHQVMRFKVPVEDSEQISKLIERIMKSQGFTDDDSMTNAGNALVHLLKDFK
jgi:ParB family chromosome partitioning protein